MNEKLLPCPFCGGKPKIIDGNEYIPLGYWIRCTKCRCYSSTRKLRHSVIKLWNKRINRAGLSEDGK